jgi:hypothetical protein
VLKYEPGQFKDLFETDLGRRLWEYLTDATSVLRMETACELGRPAVEGIAVHLEESFGPEIASDPAKLRWKQMVGHMTRQVLEKYGFQVDMQGVRVSRGTLFSKATRYRFTAAEMLLKLQQDLAEIREGAERAGPDRSAVEAQLKRAAEFWVTAEVAHPTLKKRLRTVIDTHNRLSPPPLKLRSLRAGVVK